MQLTCKIFGHSWRYYKNIRHVPHENIRACKRCGRADRLGIGFDRKTVWIMLVEYKKKYAEQKIKQLQEVK